MKTETMSVFACHFIPSAYHGVWHYYKLNKYSLNGLLAGMSLINNGPGGVIPNTHLKHVQKWNFDSLPSSPANLLQFAPPHLPDLSKWYYFLLSCSM